MRALPHLSVLSLLFTCLVDFAAAAGPAPFSAQYDLSQGMLKFGTLQRVLELGTDGSYRFTAEMHTSGLMALLRAATITETSRGQLRGERFVPDRYEYRNSRGNRQFALRFDHASGRVLRDDQTHGWSAAMPDRVLDKLVYQAQMMVDAASAPATLQYAIADKDKLKSYAFANRGSEDLTVPAGHFHTLRFERGGANTDRHTTVWCASELGWLPVKVEYRESDGGVTTAELRNLAPP